MSGCWLQQSDFIFRYVHQGSILECTDDIFQRCFDINVRSMFWMVKSLIDKIPDGGSIINMSSVASSIKGAPNRFAYGTTKAAVIGLTKSLAVDFVSRKVAIHYHPWVISFIVFTRYESTLCVRGQWRLPHGMTGLMIVRIQTWPRRTSLRDKLWVDSALLRRLLLWCSTCHLTRYVLLISEIYLNKCFSLPTPLEPFM